MRFLLWAIDSCLLRLDERAKRIERKLDAVTALLSEDDVDLDVLAQRLKRARNRLEKAVSDTPLPE